MDTVSVSDLKTNPGDALRRAKRDVLVVMNRDRPDALMVGIAAIAMSAQQAGEDMETLDEWLAGS